MGNLSPPAVDLVPVHAGKVCFPDKVQRFTVVLTSYEHNFWNFQNM